jgi:hypothetical protein
MLTASLLPFFCTFSHFVPLRPSIFLFLFQTLRGSVCYVNSIL